MRRAGLLNEVIEIYKLNVSKNDYGQEVRTWDLKLSTRAKVSYNTGSRDTENSEITHNYTKSFTVRYYVNVEENDQIKWGGKLYRILEIERSREYQQIVINTELIND